MGNHFVVEQSNSWIRIKQRSHFPFYYYCIYVDGILFASFYQGTTFYVDVTSTNPRQIMIIAFYLNYGMPVSIVEQFLLTNYDNRPAEDRTFKPGDILVASDNVNQMLTGYIGHSALVVDEENVVESPGGHPALRKDSIQQFLDKHPQHAHFRPKSSQDGKEAANYAIEYLQDYEQNLKDGKQKPVFSYSLSQSLDDPWEYIYCSKLIYLSYLKGAGYDGLENDFLWYSPEDLYSNLKESKDFEKIYEHEDVNFNVNT